MLEDVAIDAKAKRTQQIWLKLNEASIAFEGEGITAVIFISDKRWPRNGQR